jgi:hypothetical protein
MRSQPAFYDERGLFLYISPAGSKCWRFKYSIQGKEKLLAFGIYPEVSLADARNKREEARKQLAEGIETQVSVVKAQNKAKRIVLRPLHTSGLLSTYLAGRKAIVVS